MWWKLGLLTIATGLLIIVIIPIKTKAIIYDPLREPPPKPTIGEMVQNMYLTPGTVIAIIFILAVATYIGWKIVRG